MFDDLESKIADTQLLIANKFAQNVKLELIPYNQLSYLSDEVRTNITLPWLIMQPAGKYTFNLYLKSINMEILSDILDITNKYVKSSFNERLHLSIDIYDKYLLDNNILSLTSEADRETVTNIGYFIDTIRDKLKDKLNNEKEPTSKMFDVPTNLFEPVVIIIKQRLSDLYLANFVNSTYFETFIQYKSYSRRPVNLDSFHAFRVLGKGAFGAVRAVRKFDTQRMFAMKVMSKGQIKQKQEFKMVINERNALAMTEQSNPGNPSSRVLSLKYAFKDDKNVYLVTQYCAGGDLGYHLKISNGKFSESRTCYYIAETLLGLDVLHKSSLIYRDMKPENLLLNSEGHCIISDLGLSKRFRADKPITNACGTPGYWAPEVMQRNPQLLTADYWSVGVLIYKCLTGHVPESVGVNSDNNEFDPFSRKSKDEDIAKKADSKPVVNINFPEYMSNDAIDLIKQLFNLDPVTRLGCNGIEEVKNHPFFKNIEWEELITGTLKPPFVPSSDTVYADSAVFRDQDDEYEKVVWSSEEEESFKNFEYCSEMSSQAEIIDSLTDVREKMPDIPPDQCGCCLVM